MGVAVRRLAWLALHPRDRESGNGRCLASQGLSALLDYAVDSTRAAGNTLTNYPYRPLLEAHVGATASGIIEVPVTLDDSQGYLTAANLAMARYHRCQRGE
jgi:hypothetical protein